MNKVNSVHSRFEWFIIVHHFFHWIFLRRNSLRISATKNLFRLPYTFDLDFSFLFFFSQMNDWTDRRRSPRFLLQHAFLPTNICSPSRTQYRWVFNGFLQVCSYFFLPDIPPTLLSVVTSDGFLPNQRQQQNLSHLLLISLWTACPCVHLRLLKGQPRVQEITCWS